ncbi:MAG: hypothetical protein Roseis2KO_30370 [Roseivirga sp.]
MGIVYGTQGEYDKAIAAYEKAIEIKPDDHEAFNNLGIVYDDKGEYDKAIAAYEKAIEIKPDSADYLMSLGFLHFTIGKLKKSEELLTSSVALGSKDFGNMNLGHVYLGQSNLKEALRCYSKSFQAFPDKRRFWEGMHDDFKHLEQYGITQTQYDEVLSKLKKIKEY